MGEGALNEDGPWHPAGPDWQRAKQLGRVKGIAAAEIQCDDPASVSQRWAEIAQLPLDTSDGVSQIRFENAAVRFVACTDGRPEGLGGIDIETTNKAAILEAAAARGKVSGEDQVYLCGMRMNLV